VVAGQAAVEEIFSGTASFLKAREKSIDLKKPVVLNNLDSSRILQRENLLNKCPQKPFIITKCQIIKYC
jgi:hypothetical protein